MTTQVEAANLVVRKLEEKERILQNTLATVEKELQLRQQAMEMHKRKAIESAQSAADLKLHLGKIFYIFYRSSLSNLTFFDELPIYTKRRLVQHQATSQLAICIKNTIPI